jgi:hypothetical protein
VEEGKGPDQGDYETPSESPSAAPSDTPSDLPSDTPSEAPSTDAHSTEPGDLSPTVQVPASPDGGGNLPTTSGADPYLAFGFVLAAAIVIVTGCLLLRRKRSRTNW